MDKYFQFLAEEILQQRLRIGGNFAVAHQIMRRKHRDLIRKIIPDCIFINLNLTEKAEKQRLLATFSPDQVEGLSALFVQVRKESEGPQKDEENIFEIVVDENMSKSDVLMKVKNII